MKPGMRRRVQRMSNENVNYSGVAFTVTRNKGGLPQYMVAYEGQVTTRVRRGKVVEIPEQWRGHILHDQTRRKRQPVKRRTRKENR